MDSKGNVEKKIAFEDLSKEELIKKCKTFLIIVQKAKQSKSLLQEEIDNLKAKLELTNHEKIPSAVDEIIQNFTEQKLNLVSTIEDLKMKNDSLVTNLNQFKEEKRRLETELDKIDNENVVFKKQVTRLTDENEQLISHLESLEKQIEELNKIGLEQRNQLLELEESNMNLQNNAKHCEKVQELEKMLSISLEEIKRLKNLKNNTQVDIPMVSIEDSFVKKGEDFDIQMLTERNGKLMDKLKCYHTKIVKLAVQVKHLKADKEEILDQFKIYTQQVRDWKDKLNIASNNLLLIVKTCEKENEELKKCNQHLEDLNTRFMEQLEAHKTDDEKSKEIEEIDNLKIKNLKLGEELDISKQNLHEVSVANEMLINKAKEENINLTQQLEALNSEKDELQIHIQQLEQCNKLDEVARERDSYEKIVCSKNEQINSFKVQIQNLEMEISKCSVEKAELTDRITELHEIEDHQRKCIFDLEEKIKKFSTELENSQKLNEVILKLSHEIKTLTESNLSLREQIETYKEREKNNKHECLNASIQTFENFSSLEEYKHEIIISKEENAQLLLEMNEMNLELKLRGENISKLEALCEELKKNNNIYETQANINVDNITEKEEIILALRDEIKLLKLELSNLNMNEKHEEIAKLKSEIDTLNEKINFYNETNNYAESDMMSTSTISRTDEIERMKDLEGSWEEKYSKLRNLAIKLKAKLKEHMSELKKEKAEKMELQLELNNYNDKMKTLQSQNAKLLEDIDEYHKRCQNYSTNSETEKENLKMMEKQLSELNIEIDNLKQEKSNTENWKKQIALKVQALRKELEEKDASRKEYEMKISKLNADLEIKEESLKLEMENHKQTKNSLQHFTYENKKNTVLNLEMQDYEKSVRDLSQKLEKKNDYITKLKGQVESQKGSISTLRDQICILEDKIRIYENDLESALSETILYKKKTAELEKDVQLKEDEILNLNQQLESTRSQIEELSTELSKDIAERQKTINTLREEKEVIYLENLNSQQTTRQLHQKLSLKEQELLTISKEYDNYKIRAQSVLWQNQNRDIGLEEKLNDNVSSLTSQVESLHSEIKELSNRIGYLQKENDELQTLRDSSNSRYEEMYNQMSDYKSQYEQLMTKYNQALDDHNETVRSLKVHAETLGQCYRQQLSDQEVRHNREIVELQSKIETSPTPAEILLPTLPSMLREEGEGSESVESMSNIPVPLEKLLSDVEDQKVHILKKQLNEHESKLSHLTELLADTEQDLVKHVQMNKVLKEEIRRHQRAVEREKHAENMEYLKNVVFKFVTLNSGDEKSRLVPVLNTILKLSPDELRKLDMVAKGEASLRGWSSYLPVWNSPSKS
ncbi:hypothetical protein WA026_006710 [Henosepilachna vigintioctopunctata]|uniref:GRIP domain-containing protein n=1 Tax=Henosepilachna vigintioctopunctata TaxID=420089 RepID=A0AAW1UF23_9CUCU